MIDVITNVMCPYCKSDIIVNCNKHIAGSTSREKDMGTDVQ